MAQYIHSIHDYCDRWCDRCPFIEKCAFIQGKLDVSENEESVQMLAWEGRQYGLQMEANCNMALDTIAEIEEVLENDDLVESATEFREVMQILLEDFSYWTEMATAQANLTASGARDGAEVLKEVRLIDKCRDLLCWDYIFVGAKVRRAVAGQLMSKGDEATQSDSNGSAKVALICVERSLNALKQIFEIVQDEERFLVPLSLLERIHKLLKERFPEAEKFIRPGFDTNIAVMARRDETLTEFLN